MEKNRYGSNYIIWEREFIKTGENIYKIGKTTQSGLKRHNQYPKDSILIVQEYVFDCDSVENEIKKTFDKVFKNRRDIGREYYEGDITSMKNGFRNIVDKYSAINIVPLTTTNQSANKIIKKYCDDPSIISSNIIFYNMQCFADRIRNILNEIVGEYNKNYDTIENDGSYNCDNDFEQIRNMVDEFFENNNTNINKYLIKLHEIHKSIIQINKKIDDDIKLLCKIVVDFLKYYVNKIEKEYDKNNIDAHKKILELTIKKYFETSEKCNGIFFGNECICQGFVRYFCSGNNQLMRFMFDKYEMSKILNPKKIDEIIERNFECVSSMSYHFIPISSYSLFANIIYYTEISEDYSFIFTTKKVLEKYIDKISKELDIQIFIEKNGYSGFVYCECGEARFITDDEKYDEDLDGWIKKNVYIEESDDDNQMYKMFFEYSEILALFDLMGGKHFRNDVVKCNPFWRECISEKYWFVTPQYTIDLSEEMTRCYIQNSTGKINRIVKAKKEFVNNLCADNKNNIASQIKLLEHWEHPVIISDESDENTVSGFKLGILDMKNIKLNNIFYYGCVINPCNFMVNDDTDYGEMMKQSFGSSYNEMMKMLNSIFIEQQNLVSIIYGCCNWINSLDCILRKIDYDANIYEGYEIELGFDKEFERLLKNKDKKVIIIRYEFAYIKKLPMLNKIIDSAKKCNANIIILTSKHNDETFKKILQNRFDKITKINYYRVEHKFLWDKRVLEFFNWFTGTKLFV